jgi:putative transposase
MRGIARLCRRSVGRRAAPGLCVIDTQTVKCISGRGPRGCDAGKRVSGRKRVALVDAAGHWLAVAVVPASVQDRDTLAAFALRQAQERQGDVAKLAGSDL